MFRSANSEITDSGTIWLSRPTKLTLKGVFMLLSPAYLALATVKNAALCGSPSSGTLFLFLFQASVKRRNLSEPYLIDLRIADGQCQTCLSEPRKPATVSRRHNNPNVALLG